MHFELNLEAIEFDCYLFVLFEKNQKQNRINQLNQLMKISGTRTSQVREHTHLCVCVY